MKWEGGRRSTNVEDRRGMGRPLAMGGGLVGVIGLVLALLFGVDPSQMGGGGGDPGGYGGSGPVADEGQPGQAAPGGAEDPQKAFVSVVLADTEDTWPQLLKPLGVQYQAPRLVLFEQAVQSACGTADSAVGPFYCPGDNKVYLDLSFFRELDQRFGAPGDFARAYVVAHEVGHHVQNLLGLSDQVHRAQQGARSQAQANQLSVMLELQADCLAGVWAHHAEAQRDLLEQGDVEEGLNAAAAIGDDTLQKRARGRVMPESFTHGSSAQRVEWFRRGMETGRIDACDTFSQGRQGR